MKLRKNIKYHVNSEKNSTIQKFRYLKNYKEIR